MAIYWQGTQDFIPGAGSDFGPSVVFFAGKVYAAWKGVGGDERVWYASYGTTTPYKYRVKARTTPNRWSRISYSRASSFNSLSLATCCLRETDIGWVLAPQ
jgi:hypothetical protein